jgi:hypothetical protein
MELDPYTRLIELCERLSGATLTGKVPWTAEEDTAFSCAQRSGSVAIRSRDRDGEAPYELVIYSPKGATVESLVSEWTTAEEPASWNAPLADLYRAARRQALGVDEILDALLDELPPAGPRLAAAEGSTPA